MTPRLALAAPLLAAALACTPHRIPGTEVRDTRENRAIFDVLRSYQAALEKRDANAVLALVAPDYRDTTLADPPELVDRAQLEQTLPADLAKAEGLRVQLTVRKIDVVGDQAQVELFYDQYYRVKTPSGEVPRRDSDLQRMRLERIGGAWKIASGL